MLRSTLHGGFKPLARALSASATTAPLLVSPTELHALRAAGDVAVLDASWHMPNSPRNAREEFLAKRIPGARYLSLDDVASTHELGLAHMMPSGEAFARALEDFGVTPTSHVILYDSHGIFSAPRALFMLRSFGHERSSVLDGGLPRWEAEGRSVEAGPIGETAKGTYPVPPAPSDAVRSYEQMVQNSTGDLSTDLTAELVVDARARGRYLGTTPEPRPGLPSGHIPGSFSLPFDTFLQTNNVPNSDKTYTTYLPPDELRKKLVDAVGPEHAQQVIDGKRAITTTCGSGMTAGVLWLGLKLIAWSTKVALYDESWTGYASRAQSPIATGDKP
ncbi:Rhodanese-like protein [Auriscalpium vulgare]|uniref:Rhodanese-like protein n=1 Tax=Auriscalpium vulgare TaxID=40419 RepID=A0ACB8RXV9_9AGAM|nr:Rhodanese-like protein [Auriscalpium vulgare]